MNIEELKVGDVVLFSPAAGSTLSEAIVLLTGAPVSHAAMCYEDNTQIIESTIPRIAVGVAKERFKDRTIHVMRFNKSVDNFQPVMSAATGYLNQEEPYPESTLYVLGGVLLYKKLSPDTIKSRFVLQILKLLAKELIEKINNKKFPGKKPMVCSQFVFQCFQDAGSPYTLNIKDGNLLKGALDNGSEKSYSLAELAVNHEPKLYQHHDLLKSNDDDLSQLFEDFKNNRDRTVAKEDVLDAVHHVLQAHHALANEIAFEDATSHQGMQLLKHQDAVFVTPADLLQHCPELNEVGEINIK